MKIEISWWEYLTGIVLLLLPSPIKARAKGGTMSHEIIKQEPVKFVSVSVKLDQGTFIAEVKVDAKGAVELGIEEAKKLIPGAIDDVVLDIIKAQVLLQLNK